MRRHPLDGIDLFDVTSADKRRGIPRDVFENGLKTLRARSKRIATPRNIEKNGASVIDISRVLLSSGEDKVERRRKTLVRERLVPKTASERRNRDDGIV